MAVSNKTLFDLLAELHEKSSNMLDFWNSAGNFYELILTFYILYIYIYNKLYIIYKSGSLHIFRVFFAIFFFFVVLDFGVPCFTGRFGSHFGHFPCFVARFASDDFLIIFLHSTFQHFLHSGLALKPYIIGGSGLPLP